MRKKEFDPMERQGGMNEEDFFPTSEMKEIFKRFRELHKEDVHGGTIVSERGRPELELKVGAGRRAVRLCFMESPEAIMLRGSVNFNFEDDFIIMQFLLMFMDDQDMPHYRTDITPDLQARFYCEEKTSSIRDVEDLRRLTLRLETTAEKIEAEAKP